MKQGYDQHYTNQTIASELVISLVNRLDPHRTRKYIEPSSGSGVFVTALLACDIPKKQIRSVDIDTDSPADMHTDFLLADKSTLKINTWCNEETVVIGNPPFGRNGKTARQFLNHAATLGDWVCFVLPRSMRDGRECGSLNSRLQLIHEHELHGAFDTTSAKCNWQEWYLLPAGQSAKRHRDPPVDTRGLYEFVGKNDRHDVVVQRCGGNAGKITACNGTGEGKWYIRTKHREVREALKNLPQHPDAKLTTHQLSMSKAMLHELIEEALLEQYVKNILEK